MLRPYYEIVKNGYVFLQFGHWALTRLTDYRPCLSFNWLRTSIGYPNHLGMRRPPTPPGSTATSRCPPTSPATLISRLLFQIFPPAEPLSVPPHVHVHSIVLLAPPPSLHLPPSLSCGPSRQKHRRFPGSHPLIPTPRHPTEAPPGSPRSPATRLGVPQEASQDLHRGRGTARARPSNISPSGPSRCRKDQTPMKCTATNVMSVPYALSQT